MYKTCHCARRFIIGPLEMAKVEVESTWEKYGAYLNPFHSKSSDSYEDLNGSKTE